MRTTLRPVSEPAAAAAAGIAARFRWVTADFSFLKMRLPASIPARMPTPSVLRHIAFPPPPAAFRPSLSVDGELRPPRINFRLQERIRKACLLADIDPSAVVGLPEKQPSKMPKSTSQSPRIKMPKGDPKLIKAVERQYNIEENMAKMGNRIKEWKAEKLKAKAGKRSELPF
ncbi:hypothetical protein BC830DRAFT_1129574 [Chytriomyces sp. MP71]|nr:hypothetical protein BC830DRAFT_1129574 [Chytriomyces sp. MP71]